MVVLITDFNYIFIQSLGIIALVFVFLAWNSKERVTILTLQSINLVLFILHYTLLYAFPAAALCIVVLLRNIVFSFKGKKKWSENPIWIYVFSTLSCLILLFFWNGWPTLLPVFAVIVSTYATWQDKSSSIRLYMLLSLLIWTPYAIIVHSIPGVLGQLIGIFGIFVGMYRHDKLFVK